MGIKVPIDLNVCHKHNGCRYFATEEDNGEPRCLRFSKHRIEIDSIILDFLKTHYDKTEPININCLGDNCKEI